MAVADGDDIGGLADLFIIEGGVRRGGVSDDVYAVAGCEQKRCVREVLDFQVKCLLWIGLSIRLIFLTLLIISLNDRAFNR